METEDQMWGACKQRTRKWAHRQCLVNTPGPIINLLLQFLLSRASGWSHEDCWLKSLVPLMGEVRQQMGGRPIYISFDIDGLDPAYAWHRDTWNCRLTPSQVRNSTSDIFGARTLSLPLSWLELSLQESDGIFKIRAFGPLLFSGLRFGFSLLMSNWCWQGPSFLFLDVTTVCYFGLSAFWSTCLWGQYCSTLCQDTKLYFLGIQLKKKKYAWGWTTSQGSSRIFGNPQIKFQMCSAYTQGGRIGVWL